jgi:glycosyltransferase involved in cell wall biosynthesis
VRILAITNLYPNPFQPHRGTFNRQQLGALANKHQVAVISPIAWTDEFAARRKKIYWSSIHRSVECDGLCVEHPRYLFPPKMLRRYYGHFFRYSIAQSFARALTNFRPDAILAAWAYPDGWAAVDLAQRAGLPAVVKVHGSDIRILPNLPGRWKRTAEVLIRADGVIAVSQELAERVIQMGAAPSRVSVVYDGINTNLFHPGPRQEARLRLKIPGDNPIILFIGNLLPVKGLDILIMALSLLRRRGVRFNSALIGQGPLEARLRHEITRLGLQDHVRLLGPMPHACLPDWYRAASVFVLPSRSEGLPCVLLEAAACGTPFVATAVGGIPEIAHLATAQLIPPENPENLADAITEILSSPEPRNGAGQYSRGHDDAARELAAALERARGNSKRFTQDPIPIPNDFRN